eukprot:jgi/Psemu1/300974/fgenesh1_kg.23_\
MIFMLRLRKFYQYNIVLANNINADQPMRYLMLHYFKAMLRQREEQKLWDGHRAGVELLFAARIASYELQQTVILKNSMV